MVLNPAPAQALPASLLALVDYLVPNELEAAALAGMPVVSVQDAVRAAQALRAAGAATVLVTLGVQGVVTVSAQEQLHTPAQRVQAVDTTGAGDTFIGGFCAALVQGRSVAAAVAYGQAAAAICVTRPGLDSVCARGGAALSLQQPLSTVRRQDGFLLGLENKAAHEIQRRHDTDHAVALRHDDVVDLVREHQPRHFGNAGVGAHRDRFVVADLPGGNDGRVATSGVELH